jgi:S1-C subfamily serine protease
MSSEQNMAWPPNSPTSWRPGPPTTRPPGVRPMWLAAAGAAVLALLLVVTAVGALAGRTIQPVVQHPPSAANQAPAAAEPGVSMSQVSAVAAKVSPGVVDINTVLGYQGGAAAGTGIVLSSDGLVLTNNHVVAGATSVSATDVDNGQTYQASVVGYDRTEDIAVVKLANASGLTVAPLGDSSTVNTGDGIVAVGNAGGTGGAPSAVGGTVTALDQSITAQDDSSGASEQLTGLIEIAAAIQPGDSGGPLATMSGQIIGVDTAASASYHVRAASGGGDGFAIPINQAMTLANQIEAGKASTAVHIGATAFLGIQAGADGSGNGASVVGVLPGSPAEAAGLSGGDVIGSINGQSVDSSTTLTGLLDQHHPGDRLTVGWTDSDGQAHTATITPTTGPVG